MTIVQGREESTKTIYYINIIAENTKRSKNWNNYNCELFKYDRYSRSRYNKKRGKVGIIFKYKKVCQTWADIIINRRIKFYIIKDII